MTQSCKHGVARAGVWLS